MVELFQLHSARDVTEWKRLGLTESALVRTGEAQADVCSAFPAADLG